MSCCTFKLLFTLLPSFLPRFLLKVTLRTVGCTWTSELIMTSPCEGDVQEQNPAMENVMCICRVSQTALSFLHATITSAYTQCSPVCVNTHTPHICFFLLFFLCRGKAEALRACVNCTHCCSFHPQVRQPLQTDSVRSWLVGKMEAQLQQRGHRPGQASCLRCDHEVASSKDSH